MPFITQGKTNLKYILIVVILAAIIGGGILGYYYLWIKDLEAKLAELEKKLPEVKLLPGELTEEGKRSNIYRITIARKPGSPEPEVTFLRWYLEDLFTLSRESISDIVYDTREGSPFYPKYRGLDFAYYIFLGGEPTELRQVYENESVTVRVINVDEKLIPYLKDPDYCEVDTDCVVRTNFCGYGAFNYYHGFHDVWGCPVVSETEFECAEPERVELEECEMGWYDEKMGCERDVEYTGIKCIENKCIAQNRIVKCLSR